MTPKESGDNVDTSVTTNNRADSGEALKGAGGSSIALERERTSRSIGRRGTVVGYGSVQDNGAAQFGWNIGPGLAALDGRRMTYVHGPGQYSLAALVSIPSWWDEVSVTVSVSWVDVEGRVVGQAKKPLTYLVRVPTDFESLEATLIAADEQAGPEILESRLDPVYLTACQPGAIVVPGRRLWRSTRVTLGFQSADEISVLPDMKGIIAKFRSVQNQARVNELAPSPGKGAAVGEIARPVRIWTSQGSVTLPYSARIGVPSGCQEQPAESVGGARVTSSK